MSHLTEPELRAYRDRRMAAGLLVRVGDHISECEDCRRKLRQFSSLDSAAELRNHTEAHLSAEQVQQVADGSLPEKTRQTIQQHLESCAECRADVDAVLQFAATWKKPVARERRVSGWLLAVAAAFIIAIGIGIWSRRPALVIALNDQTGQVSLDARGRLQGLAGLTEEQTAEIRQVLQGGGLETPAILPSLRPRPGTLMGSSAPPGFRLEGPVGTAVLSPLPVFRWTTYGQGAVYVVTLKNLASGQVLSSPAVSELKWTPNRSLQPGAVYEWQVAATISGREEVAPVPPSPPARFQVLDSRMAQQMERLPQSHLARAIVYADAALLDDAVREAYAVVAENPGSAMAQNLIRKIMGLRH